MSKESRMISMKIVPPPRRGHDFRCQRSGEGRTSFHLILGALAGPLEIPWVLRCAQKTLTMINSICLETIDCFSSRLISVKALRTGRFTPCEPSSGRFSAPKPTRRVSKTILMIIITLSRNRRLRRECCLNVVLEHPGAPNGWRRGPQEHQEGSQESPKKHRRATKSTRSDAKRAPKTPQRKPI